MKSLLVIAMLLTPAFCFGDVCLLWQVTDHFTHIDDYHVPDRYDVQKDGKPELIQYSRPLVFRAIDKNQSEIWSYTIDPSEFCPSCTDPQYWENYFRGFFDTEPGERDAVIDIVYNDYDTDTHWRGVVLVSTSSTTGFLRQVIPDRGLS